MHLYVHGVANSHLRKCGQERPAPFRPIATNFRFQLVGTGHYYICVETVEIRFRWDVEDSPNIEQVGCVFYVQFDVFAGPVGVQIEVLKRMKMDMLG